MNEPSQTTLIYQLLAKVDRMQQSIDRLSKATPTPAPTEYMSLDQAALFICRSKKTLYGLVYSRSIPFSKTGKRLIFRRADLEQWIEQGKRKTVQEELTESEDELIKQNKRKPI